MTQYKLNENYLPGKRYKLPKGTALMVDSTGVYLISDKELDEDELKKIQKDMQKKNNKK